MGDTIGDTKGLSGETREESTVIQTVQSIANDVWTELNPNLVPVQSVALSSQQVASLGLSESMGQLNSIVGELPSLSTLKSSKYIHEDGVKRSGNVWTACSHIITAVIGAGVLALPYAMASLGWILGVICFVLFAAITLYTAQLLADLYIIDGVRQRTFTQMVQTTMGYQGMVVLGILQQFNLILTALAYTITAAQSMKSLANSACGDSDSCFNKQWAMGVIFGGFQLFLSQVPTLEAFWWSSAVGAVMSFGYSIIAFGLTVGYHGTNGGIKPLDTGTTAGTVWNVLNSLGAVLFAYSFSFILLEIQDTLQDAKGKKTGPISSMKWAVNISVTIMTGFYIAIACAGFASLGYDLQPGGILEDYQGIAPAWVIDMANAMVLVHMVPAYQVWSQPHFDFAETWITKTFKDSRFIPSVMTKGLGLRLWYRTIYVVLVTFLAVLLPFFSAVLGFVGAVGFWPATVFFPINCWIKVFRPRRTLRFFLHALDFFCFIVTLLAIAGSVEAMIDSAKNVQVFSS